MANTYNPIVSKKEMPRWRILSQRPVPDAGTALVFSGEGQSLLTIKQGQRGPTGGEILWGKYNLVYKVDTTEHPLNFRFNLPCATDAFDFHAQINFTCAVHDPEMIVRRNVNDVRQFLEPLIVGSMRRISRNYLVEESAAAEREIGNTVRQEIYDVGFQLKNFVLKLSLEEEVRNRIREKKRIQETTDIEKTKIYSQKTLEEEAQKLEMQRQQFEIERIRQQEQFELERTKLKMEFYGPLLQAGNWQMLALQLSQNPQDVQIIMQQIQQQNETQRNHQIKMLEILLKEDAVEGSQLNEESKRLLQGLLGLSEQSTAVLETSLTDTTKNQKHLPEAENTEDESSVSDIPEEFQRKD